MSMSSFRYSSTPYYSTTSKTATFGCLSSVLIALAVPLCRLLIKCLKSETSVVMDQSVQGRPQDFNCCQHQEHRSPNAVEQSYDTQVTSTLIQLRQALSRTICGAIVLTILTILVWVGSLVASTNTPPCTTSTRLTGTH